MKTIDEIVSAAATLDADQLLSLRKKLDRLEKKLWEKELARVTKKMKRAGITEEKIDRMVLRRRYQGRT